MRHQWGGIMENKLSKEEIADYLVTYALFYDEMCHNPLRKMKSSFKSVQIKKPNSNNTKDYYDRMLKIRILYNTIKEYSMEYDENSRYLTESILKSKINLDDIFINSDDAKHFSYKNILKFIRNALNHSVERELYSIDSDGNIEIHLKNVNPRPFHVKLDSKKLNELTFLVSDYSEHSTVYMVNGLEKINIEKDNIMEQLDDLKLVRYYYKSKNSDNLKEVLTKIHDENGQSAMDQYIEDSVNNGTLLKREYCLDDKQKEFLAFYLTLPNISDDIGIMNKEFYKEMMISDCVKYMIPFGPLKSKIYNNNVMIDAYGLSNWNNTFQSLIDYSDKKYLNSLTDRLDVCSFDRIVCNYLTYVSFIFDNVNSIDDINVDGDTYDLERIRNACVHGRWGVFSDHINGNYYVCLYDWPNGIENENNYVWHMSMPFEELLELASKVYNKNLIINQIKKDNLEKLLCKK